MNIRTLLVDDSPETLDTLVLVFSLHPDVEVVGAVHTMAEAVEFLRTTTVDLVSIDIQLGSGSGFDLCEYVDERYPDIFVTMCSLEAHDRNQSLASKVGAEHFLAKPLSLEDMNDLAQKYKEFRNHCANRDRKEMKDSDDWLDQIVEGALLDDD